jgi:hypothetical protein
VIIRRWTITKAGQSTTCEQRITVLPITEYDICFPRDATADCKSVKADSAFTASLGCDVVAVNVSDKRYDASDSECYKIFRTYTVINWCAYDDRCGDPMATGHVYVVDRGTFGNNGKNQIYVLVRDKNRDGDEEFWLSQNRTPEDAGDIRFTPPLCDATDDYFHSFMYTQIIKVEDTQLPVVTRPQLNVFPTRTTDCLADVTITFQGSDNCSAKVDL